MPTVVVMHCTETSGGSGTVSNPNCLVSFDHGLLLFKAQLGQPVHENFILRVCAQTGT